MHMPRQYMVAGVCVWLMLQGERAHQQRLRDHLDAQIQRWVAGAFVVIAANQGQGQWAIALTPGPDCVQVPLA